MLILGFERNDETVVVYKTLLNVFGWTERYLQVADVQHGVLPRTCARNYSWRYVTSPMSALHYTVLSPLVIHKFVFMIVFCILLAHKSYITASAAVLN